MRSHSPLGRSGALSCAVERTGPHTQCHGRPGRILGPKAGHTAALGPHLRSAITCAIKPRARAKNDKGLPKKAFEINYLFWLLDLGSNQGPTD